MVEGDRNAETLLEAPPPPEPQKGAAGGEPIAPSLGVDYAFPRHLEYAYPPPDGNILTNVVNALIAVPRFYTQVLHLMNKMNLPPPFRPALPTPPLPPPAPAPAPPALKRQAGDLSSGESELESSEEEEQSEATDGTAEGADKVRRKKPKKRMKREPILGPALDKGASHEAAGVKTVVIPKATTTIKKKAPVLQIKITPKSHASEAEPSANSKLEEAMAPETIDEPHEEEQATASREELEGGKLQASDMLALPILKNYTPGNPTPNLYIKNLAKDVTADDMYYIFGAFFHNRAEALEQLSVKVMQEGRMRGQAFVYCPSTEIAMAALAGTHGYVLKGKPMVVQYGRKQAVTKTATDAIASGGGEQ